MNRFVVAMSGWRSSGKDTTADYLVAQHGFQKLSFAAKLKDMVSNTYGVPREDLDSPTKKEMPLVSLPVIPTDRFTETVHTLLRSELQSGYWTPRALCILEGSIKRSVYSNFWVRTVAAEIMNNPEQSYVISDMRYLSEVDTLKMLIPNIRTVRVNRFDSIATEDPSERDLDNYVFDVTLTNTGVKELLYDQIDSNIIDVTSFNYNSRKGL